MKVILTLALVRALLVHASSAVAVDWDVLIFTQQWPITSCLHHMEQNPKASCNLFPNMTTWTIHGIWPTKLGTIGPNFCNNSWHFNETQVISIEPYLIKYWSNIYGEDSQTSLWKHEWDKHGTCAAQLPELSSELKYFGKGLDWAVQHDFVAILSKSMIYPHDIKTYSRNDIFNAINDVYGVNPAIDCVYSKKTKDHKLSQIKLCFDPTLTLVDCDGIIGEDKDVIGNCPKTGIFYPSSIRTGGLEYSYPIRLVAEHRRLWEEAQGRCSSWVCRALNLLISLMWITL